MGKTITTYLINGNPQGTKYFLINNKTCKMYSIPRAELAVINDIKDLQSSAFYILLGEDESEKPKAYLGETTNFKERIKDHDYKKEWWQKALIFVSPSGTISKSDVQYLQHLANVEGTQSKKYIFDKGQTPKEPDLLEHQKDSNIEFFEDVKFLTLFAGCDIFEVIKQKDKQIFFIRNRGCDAKGFYHENGFTVLRTSKIAKDTVDSFTWKEKRQKEFQELTIKEGDAFISKIDKTFSSPSTAAAFCTGTSINGWKEWRDTNGKSLDDVYRKKLDEVNQ